MRRPARFASLLAVLCTAEYAVSGAAEPGTDPEVLRLARSAASAADGSESESDPARRHELVQQAERDAEACLARAPRSGACEYARALALGVAAREHPMRALGLLKDMLRRLERAEAADPDYDSAGAARVQAQVLAQAPGWPLGPGDGRAALAAAQRAAQRHPEFPPNLLALAQAQAKNGDRDGARASFSRARDAAEALPPSADRTEWLEKAQRGLAAH